MADFGKAFKLLRNLQLDEHCIKQLQKYEAKTFEDQGGI